ACRLTRREDLGRFLSCLDTPCKRGAPDGFTSPLRSMVKIGTLIRPAQQDASGRVSRAYRHEQHQVSLFHFLLFNSVAQAKRNRPASGVAVAVDVDHDPLVWEPETLLHSS